MALNGKLALVTGSASGLGKSAAWRLAEHGCDVAINYVHSKQAAERMVREIEAQYGVKAYAVQADVGNAAEVDVMVKTIEHTFGRTVDILINNAGPFVRERTLFADYAWEAAERLVRTNLLGVMQLDHLVIPGMRANQWGRIVHFGFAHAGEARGWPHRAAYAAAKVGLVSFTKTLAVEEAANGITVNMICPGDVRGDYKEKRIADALDKTDAESPRGRPGTGEDVMRVLEFLCLDASDFITGNVIDISGGLDPIRTLPLRR